jgi:hypothetical protein
LAGEIHPAEVIDQDEDKVQGLGGLQADAKGEENEEAQACCHNQSLFKFSICWGSGVFGLLLLGNLVHRVVGMAVKKFVSISGTQGTQIKFVNMPPF